MEEIDLRDGSKNGQIGADVRACASRGRKPSPVRGGCLYGGASMKNHHAFRV